MHAGKFDFLIVLIIIVSLDQFPTEIIEIFDEPRPGAIIARCYGNETSLLDCLAYADEQGVPCSSHLAAAVRCISSESTVIFIGISD
ncbi:unnamed protein product [Protopolystoma xenopodis]|uniref:Uncharacterized protein n=1 Tax=Protopolystoma xenopodis TaxID=117903 RepID=A0A3S5ARA0_9PLAT|nr:unnamed protein product [Protopolystoma xenopodis]